MAVPATTATRATPARLKMSYAEFLQWSDEDSHAEWVNGEVIVQMPPKDSHQATLGFLARLLGLFVDLFDLGKVRVAPFEVKLIPGGSSREPDIFFVARANLQRLTEDRVVGPPDLVIEIISAESVRRDRHTKFREYRDAGVSEYWLLDPRAGKHTATFFQLNTRGEDELFATEADARVASHVLSGFWLRPTWLWEADTLDPLAVFCEMAGLPATFAAQLRQQIQASFRQSGIDGPPE